MVTDREKDQPGSSISSSDCLPTCVLDQKLTLLTIELKNEGAVVVRNLLILVVGGVLATLGLLLLGMAAAAWIGTAIGSVPGGYGIVGLVFVLGGGGLLAVVRGRRNAAPSATKDPTGTPEGREMDQGRVLEAERLSQAMKTTRAAITNTVGELRENVNRAVDWRAGRHIPARPWARRRPGACSWVIGLAPR